MKKLFGKNLTQRVNAHTEAVRSFRAAARSTRNDPQALRRAGNRVDKTYDKLSSEVSRLDKKASARYKKHHSRLNTQLDKADHILGDFCSGLDSALGLDVDASEVKAIVRQFETNIAKKMHFPEAPRTPDRRFKEGVPKNKSPQQLLDEITPKQPPPQPQRTQPTQSQAPQQPRKTIPEISQQTMDALADEFDSGKNSIPEISQEDFDALAAEFDSDTKEQLDEAKKQLEETRVPVVEISNEELMDLFEATEDVTHQSDPSVVVDASHAYKERVDTYCEQNNVSATSHEEGGLNQVKGMLEQKIDTLKEGFESKLDQDLFDEFENDDDTDLTM